MHCSVHHIAHCLYLFPKIAGLILPIQSMIYSCAVPSVHGSIVMLKIWIPSSFMVSVLVRRLPLLHSQVWWRGVEPNLQIKTLKGKKKRERVIDIVLR